jgi:predicted permease
MPSFFQEVSHAFRALRKRPGFAFAALMTLAVGIGANVTVFSVVNALLLRPLPFGERSDRVVTLHSTHPMQVEDWDDSRLSYPDLVDVQRETASFEGVAGFVSRNFTVTNETEAERVLGESVTPNLFPVLGVEPILGRNFLSEEAAAPGLETTVILSHGLWMRRFGGDRSIIGRGIVINERARTVVGVMPPGFKFPERSELYMPFRGDEMPRSGRSVPAIGVLKRGVSLEQAQSELTALAARLETRHPDSNRDYSMRVLRFRDARLGRDDRAFAGTLMAAVAFVLLIACANLANLLLVRGAARQREMAVRAAMGASRGRLIWAVLSETAVLACAGSVIGAFAALWMVDYMRGLWPEEMPYWIRFDVDARMVLFTILLTALTTVITGLLPALRASRQDVVGDLKEGGRSVSLGRSAQRVQAVLAAAQLALCLALLVGANLMIRSFLSLQRADLGFDDAPVLTMRAYLAGDKFDDPKARAAFFVQSVEALKSLPGVRHAVATSSIPGDDGGGPARIVIDGRTNAGDEVPIQVIATTSELFDTFGLRMIAGRTFTPAESLDPESAVALVNERLAQRLWPNTSALDRRIGFRGAEGINWIRVVGVAPNVHYEEAGEQTAQSQMNVFLPYALTAPRTAAVLVRTDGDPQTLMTPARDALRKVHAGLPVYDIRTMRQVRRFTTWEQQLYGVMMGTFAATALLLACLGIYALLAYAAQRRTQEIGVRLALGANASDVVTLFMRQAWRIGAAGLVGGVALGIAVARALSGVLFAVEALDPWLFAGTAGALLVAVAAASYFPARRAATTDPMLALRAD